MSSPFPPGFDVVQLYLITYLAEWSLFSTLTVQLYLYYQAFPNDRLWTKSLVYLIYAIHLVEIILATISAFKTFGFGFGDIAALTDFDVSSIWSDIIPALVSLIVQSFYAYRLRLLSQSWSIPGPIVAVPTVAFVLNAGNISQLTSQKISILGGIWLGGSALIDIVIAGCMTYYLTTNDAGFRRTKELVSKLVRLTIETGALTAMVALLTLILFFAFPGKVTTQRRPTGGRSTYTSDVNIVSSMGYSRDTTTTGGSATIRGSDDEAVVSISRHAFTRSDTDAPVEMKFIHRDGEPKEHVAR
ncbi:hypothetical protein R3P38DRAFT_3451448 [Favolaschia claudopus]|uniref:DUF6534 domain-containing protein n=1 Tax=Favolaschia claudopus TaxID=2862362 RepID=A0AAV9ZKN6_9AGAR